MLKIFKIIRTFIFLSAILQERRMVLTSYELSHPSFLTQPNDSFCFFFNTWVNLKSLPRFIFWSEVEEALQDSQRRKIKHGVSQQDYGIVNLHSINKKHKMAIWRDTDIYFWKRSQLCVQSISENLQTDDSLCPRQYIWKLYKGVPGFDQHVNHYFFFYEIVQMFHI